MVRKRLVRLETLRLLFIPFTGLTDAEMAELRSTLPRCRIIRSSGD